jgi:hypothetical protein
MASTIKSNTVTNATASTLTLGESGTTVTLACGATQSGFGRTGTVDWCTTAKTSPLTAVSGKGYFINTCGGAVTVTLPASPSAGDIVSLSDYKNTWATACKSVTLGRNSSKINGSCNDSTLDTQGQSVTMIYVDGTRGWKSVQDSTSNITGTPTYIQATGGTITTSGDYKIHTFNADATFDVASAPTPANNTIDYLVVAGGGGGGGGMAYNDGSTGGGGAGGYRFSDGTASGCYSAGPAPLGASGTPISVQSYPISVGAGAAAQTSTTPGSSTPGIRGSNTIFSTITSAGGGGGKAATPNPTSSGGSGGGGNYQCSAGGAGNTPPVSPSQGNAGGAGSPSGPPYASGGGGGASAVGGVYAPGTSGAGAAGLASSITGGAVTRGGGGGGGGSGVITKGGGGAGGGGAGGSPADLAGDGTVNTGGGGGAANTNPHPSPGTTTGAGGSGVVILRYKYQ